jgi:polysaccharide transporter, PST family
VSRSLQSLAVRGTIFNGCSQMLRMSMSLIGTIVLARLLTPADFGIIAMVVPLTAFAALLQNFGLHQALIQAPSLDSDTKTSAFWINVGLTTVTALLVLASAPLVALAYGVREAGLVAAASSATIFVSGFTQTHASLLARDLRFGKLAAMDLATAAVLLVASVALAWWIGNFWALFIGSLAAALANLALLWTLSGWTPGFRGNFAGARELFGLAGAVSGFNFLNFIARQADNLIVGVVEGPRPLGLYDRAYRLMTIPISTVTEPLGRVMLPVLSRLASDPERYRRAFLHSVWGMVLAVAPGASVAAIFSDGVIALLLGREWASAAPIFFWLSIAGVYQPLSSATGWLFITLDRRKDMLRWAVFSAGTTVASFAVGIQWGVVGLAKAYVLVSLARLPLLYVYATRGTTIRPAELYSVFVPIIGAALGTLALQTVAHSSLSVPVLIAMAVVLSYCLAFLIAWLIPGGRHAIRKTWQLLGEQWREIRASKLSAGRPAP